MYCSRFSRIVLSLLCVLTLLMAGCTTTPAPTQPVAGDVTATTPARTEERAAGQPLATIPAPSEPAAVTATREALVERPAETPPVEGLAEIPAAAATAESLAEPTAATVDASAMPPPERPASQASMGDPFYPELGNGGYDVLHYTLDLAVAPTTNMLTGTMTMEAAATQGLSAFNLDLLDLTVTGVTVGEVAADFDHAPPELTITPAETIASGTTFTATVSYTGTPKAVLSKAIAIEMGWKRSADGIFVVSEPEGSATWFPVNDHPRDKATYTFRVNVPEPYVVAANGILRNTLDQGTTTTYIWETEYPMASYLATVNIEPFVIERETGPDGLPIRNFYPTDLADRAEKTFERTGEMIDYFSSLFGPFPFEAYGVVVPSFDLGAALETQTLSVFGRDIITRVPADFAQQIVAHELVHQWFGNSVSVENWKDIWLTEGFATYGEWLWLEHSEGPGAAEAAVRNTYRRLPAQHVPPGNPPANDLFNGSIYGRGGLTLEALRRRVDDEVFFRILRTYLERYKYGNASTDDFITVAEEVSDQDLSAFFDAWLFGEELPPIPELALNR